jgi:hypothetical protein
MTPYQILKASAHLHRQSPLMRLTEDHNPLDSARTFF